MKWFLIIAAGGFGLWALVLFLIYGYLRFIKKDKGVLRYIETHKKARRLSKPKSEPLTPMRHEPGATIMLWAKDEMTARKIGTDSYFLLGVLMGDNSAGSRAFQEKLRQGGSLSYRIIPNLQRGGYNVELALK